MAAHFALAHFARARDLQGTDAALFALSRKPALSDAENNR
jgi:hypothetical protein